jgi:hypothetical protein
MHVAVAATGFTNKSLRACVAGLLAQPYTSNQMSYDLARLRLNRLIIRLPHSNTYVLTPDGQRVAVFYTKIYQRLLRPLLAADAPPAPPDLRSALHTIDQHVRHYTDTARPKTTENTWKNSRQSHKFHSPRRSLRRSLEDPVQAFKVLNKWAEIRLFEVSAAGQAFDARYDQ